MGHASRPRLACLAVLAALALAGCGRRGPLELPPGAPQTQSPAAAEATQARVLGDQDDPGLIQSPDTVHEIPASTQQQVFKAAPAPPAINAPPVDRRLRFPLDPLL